MCVEGRLLNAGDAVQAGLVDLIAVDDLLQAAMTLSRTLSVAGSWRRTRALLVCAATSEAGHAAIATWRERIATWKDAGTARRVLDALARR